MFPLYLPIVNGSKRFLLGHGAFRQELEGGGRGLSSAIEHGNEVSAGDALDVGELRG